MHGLENERRPGSWAPIALSGLLSWLLLLRRYQIIHLKEGSPKCSGAFQSC